MGKENQYLLSLNKHKLIIILCFVKYTHTTLIHNKWFYQLEKLITTFRMLGIELSIKSIKYSKQDLKYLLALALSVVN